MQTINTRETGAQAFQGPLSYAEMMRPSRTRIDGTNQFYANLDQEQEKNLGKRAKHWDITKSEEPLSQKTFQKIVDMVARPGRSAGGLRFRYKEVATTTSSETRKRRRIPRRGQRSTVGDS